MKKFILLLVFSLAFGLLEAAVVAYLRQIWGFPAVASGGTFKVAVNLGFMAILKETPSLFNNVRLESVEKLRELATIAMLLTIAYLAGSKWKERLGAFFISFSIWDLSYYLFLRVFIGWPKSVWDIDIYFLHPVPSAGPVLTPIVFFSTLLVVGARLSFASASRKRE